MPRPNSRRCSWLMVLAALLAVAVVPSRAAFTNALPMAATSPPASLIENLQLKREDFWRLYARQLEANGNRTVTDRLGYSATLGLVRALNRQEYGFHAHMASVGNRLFSSAMLDSLRETCVETLPLAAYLEEGNSLALRFSARLLAGSLGNTLEERSFSVSASPSYTVLERSWLSRARESGLLDYGIRPWRVNPYAYFTLAIGHFGGKPMVVVDSRCYSLLDSWRIGLMRIQEQAVIPLFNACHLVLGLCLYPTEMDSRNLSPTISMRLERALRHGRHPALWYVGAQSGPHGTRCSTGFALLGW